MRTTELQQKREIVGVDSCADFDTVDDEKRQRVHDTVVIRQRDQPSLAATVEKNTNKLVFPVLLPKGIR